MSEETSIKFVPESRTEEQLRETIKVEGLGIQYVPEDVLQKPENREIIRQSIIQNISEKNNISLDDAEKYVEKMEHIHRTRQEEYKKTVDNFLGSEASKKIRENYPEIYEQIAKAEIAKLKQLTVKPSEIFKQIGDHDDFSVSSYGERKNFFQRLPEEIKEKFKNLFEKKSNHKM